MSVYVYVQQQFFWLVYILHGFFQPSLTSGGICSEYSYNGKHQDIGEKTNCLPLWDQLWACNVMTVQYLIVIYASKACIGMGAVNTNDGDGKGFFPE